MKRYDGRKGKGEVERQSGKRKEVKPEEEKREAREKEKGKKQ